MNFNDFDIFTTNDNIAKLTPNDIDLLSQGKKFEILISREYGELAQHV